ncbi:hypothetical protein Dimus_038307 [Dionaea muscipula]
MGMRIDDARCSLDEDDIQHVRIAFPEAPRVSVGTVPRMHEVVTLENLEDFHITTVLHPRGTWAELIALYGENSYLNSHPILYEISSTGEEDEDEEEDADDEYSDGGDRDDTD